MYGPVAPFKFAAVLLGVAILLTLVYVQHQRMKGEVFLLPPSD
jgi:hypothetical protein